MEIKLNEMRQFWKDGFYHIEVDVETPFMWYTLLYRRKKENDAKRVFYKRIGKDIGELIHDDIISSVCFAFKRAASSY